MRFSSKKRHISMMLLIAMFVSWISTTRVYAEDVKDYSADEQINSVTLLTEVPKTGEKAIALAVEYKTEIDGSKLANDLYQVSVSLDENNHARTITKVYSNNLPQVSENSKVGKYVIIELGDKDTLDYNGMPISLSNPLVFSLDTFLNTRKIIDYSVKQVKDITSNKGSTIKASEKVFTNKNGDNYNIKTPVVDEFKSATHKVAGVGSLDYRMFSPDVKDGEKYPLVLFLHGAGERGINNDLQLLGNQGGVAWASPENQAKNPSFVVAPQVQPTGEPSKANWASEGNYQVLMDLVDELTRTLPIDTNRIYITGMSMGGMGTWTVIERNPELFAGAIPVCGGFDGLDVSKIKDMPIWTFHAEDDPVVPVQGTRDLVDSLKALGSPIKYTEYPAGTIAPNAHASWEPVYEDPAVLDWLYAQSIKPNDQVKSVTLLTEVETTGEKTVGLAVEYPFEIDNESLPTKDLDKAFEVNVVNAEGVKENRKITNLYVNNEPKATKEAKSGNYVIIELDKTESAANTLVFDMDTFLNTRQITNYSFKQLADIKAKNGDIIKGSGYEYLKTNESTPIVDDFKSSTHNVEGVGSLNYRMFSPDVKDGQKYPLVLFLHGAGERGSNNDLQLLGNKGAVAWASPENQAKNPSFVVAPQKLPTGYPTEDNWTTGETYEVLMDLVKELVKDLPVDTDRIYITGMSMGGNGTWTLIQRNPELFAAAVPVCGWLDNPEDIQGIKDMPIWTFHAADDFVVDVNKTRSLVKSLKDLGSTIKYTEYDPGVIAPNPHASWEPVYDDVAVLDWLYAQNKTNNSKGEEVNKPTEKPDSNQGGNSGTSSDKNSGSLPNTGAPISPVMLVLLSLGAVGSGRALLRKKKA